MTGPESLTPYCTVCGGPILQSGCFEGIPGWLSSTTILYNNQQYTQEADPEGFQDDTQEDTQEDIQQEISPYGDVVEAQAEVEWGVYFKFLSLDRPQYPVMACDGNFRDEYTPVNFPLHTACLSLVKEVSALRLNNPPEIVLFDIWKTIFDRFLDCSHRWYGPKPCLPEENGYYGVNKVQDLQYQHVSGDPVHDLIRRCAEADPVLIPDLSLMVLENLQVVPVATSNNSVNSNTHTTFAQLPYEINQQILMELQPFSDLLQTCTYQLPPQYWKQMLVDGALIPWLPALDQDCVRVKEAEAREKNIEWDWERLMRSLSHLSPDSAALQKEQGDMKLPAGLINRRRIWKLAENMLKVDKQ